MLKARHGRLLVTILALALLAALARWLEDSPLRTTRVARTGNPRLPRSTTT
ncbi:MAG: hypothetical protein IPK54_04015 [Dokdonella sp.]|uniref:hypothetical protein n=1 Tax=Dokdonella sp. TaxID=2291710 RepID=UPI0025C1F221|nr:hypothetical protein [Dokdonella sp.]MBK8122727.1 hypothetical protein [Dokdonella sp.]